MVLVTHKQISPLKHRKRNGQHHKRTKDYHKSYWPYLPMLAIVGVGFIVNLLWTPLSHGALHQYVLSYATSTGADSLLAETNLQRSTNQEATLTINSQLTAAAQAKANDMAQRDYWAHITPDGVEPWWFVTQAGYSYRAVGENLAYGFDDSAATVTGWMNSPGHRANILNTAYQEVGFGIVNAASYQSHGPQTIVVALYGKPLAAGVKQAPVAATQPAPPEPSEPTQQSAPTGSTQKSTATQPGSQPAKTAEPLPANPSPGLSSPGGQVASQTANDPRTISRLELVGSNLPSWSLATTTIILMVAAAIFIGRHVRYLHRILVRGERFALGHPAFDFTIIGLIVIGVLLTRTAGFIH